MDAQQILKDSRVVIADESYNLISLKHDLWQELIQKNELSPRMKAPFMIFMDRHEVTLILDDVDFDTIRHALGNTKIERGFRLLSFDSVMDFSVVGFIALVSNILADAGIPIVPLSSFSRDHLLIKQTDLAAALKALGPHVGELC